MKIDDEQFFVTIQQYAKQYQIGEYLIQRLVNGLWVVLDANKYRLTTAGVFMGAPRDEAYPDGYKNWEADTEHEFKDAFTLLVKSTGVSI